MTPAGEAAGLRSLFRDAPTGELDSGWRVGVPGEEATAHPPAGTRWVPWAQALEVEPVLGFLGHAAPGARYVVRRENGAAPEVRDGRSGVLVAPGEPVAPGGGAAGSPFIAELAARALRFDVLPSLRERGRPEAAERALDALWGAAFLVPIDRASGTPLVYDDAVLGFGDEASTLAWQDGFALGESVPPLQFIPLAALVLQAPGHARRLALLTGERPGLSLEVGPLRERALGVDSEALMVLRAHDAEALAEMAARPGRVWIALRDAASPEGAPLRLRDHRTGASLLPVFATRAHAVAYDDLAEPVHVSLDEVRERWEPETGLILGLGSEHAPVELGWGRLRSSGFSAPEGARPYSAPAPGAVEAPDEPPAVRPLPLPAVSGAWEANVGPTERAVMDAVLELPKIPIDGAFVLLSLGQDKIEVGIAYVVDGQAHSADHVCGGSAGAARVALLRLRVVQLVGPWLAAQRAAGRATGALLRLQALPGGGGGALTETPGPGTLGEKLQAWVAAQGVPAHECLGTHGVLGSVSAHVSLSQAAAQSDRAAAVRALGSGAALWIVLDAAGHPLHLNDPAGSGWALACFSSEQGALDFAPAGRPERAWSRAMAEGLGGGERLVLDPGTAARPLVLRRDEVAWPGVSWGRNAS